MCVHLTSLYECENKNKKETSKQEKYAMQFAENISNYIPHGIKFSLSLCLSHKYLMYVVQTHTHLSPIYIYFVVLVIV